MKIYITGLPSGYEVEHLVRLFYPMAPLTLTPPEEGEDCVWAEKKEDSLYAMVREQGQSRDAAAPLPRPVEAGGETVEFTLASLTYDLLRSWTGIRPPWGKMTGVRPVRLIHDKRAAGWTEADIDRFFLERFDCSRQKYDMAKAIADLQEPILKLGSAPKTYSLYLGIPFCPSRCSYCSFVSCNLDRDRKLVQPYVDCLCREVEAIREQADKAGLKLCSIYIGGGTPTSLSADQLRQLMGTVRENFDLSKVVEYTVEAGRPDCTDAEKLAVIKEYGATRISINPQTFSDEVLAGIGRKHSAQDILDCYAEARKAGHDDINMDLIAGLPGDTVESFERSLRQAIALDPENITVHTLTLKRASRIVIEDQKENDYADVAAMLEKCNLLAEAGYENGVGFPETTYLYNTDDKHQAVAEALQSMWKNVLGVEVTLNNQDWNVFLETRSKGDYSICRNGWIADYNDPVSFLDMFMTDNGNNDAHYSNAEYDAIMTKVLSDSDAAGRMELMHQAEDLLVGEDQAIAPLYYYSQPYMVADDVHGMYYTPLGNFLFFHATKG